MLSGKPARHLSRVLRLRAGDHIVLFDGSGWEFPAEILEVVRQGVRVRVGEGVEVDRESFLSICLGLGLCQPAVMDLVVQKATELGISEIVPVDTERSQGWLGGRTAAKLERWVRIAREAARQCGRNRVPRISLPTDLTGFLCRDFGHSLRLILWEQETRCGLKQILASEAGGRRAVILIGPEGGFGPDEVDEAVRAGFRQVSLGPRILRTETAVITVVGLLQYELGDLSPSV